MPSLENAMYVATQDEIDRAFAEFDHFLESHRPVSRDRPLSQCVDCGEQAVTRSYDSDYAYVCDACGVVQPSLCFPDSYFYPVVHCSNYKRIYHWHERISQFLLMESRIPDKEFALIHARLCDGTYAVLDKKAIREVLRSLGMQKYIEKWLQIIHRITGIQPPCPGPQLVLQLDKLFTQLQKPFTECEFTERRNFLNYNYVFCRLFQRLGCERFCMFFPLVSSAKCKVLNSMWQKVAAALEWDVPPMPNVPPLAVKLSPHLISSAPRLSACVSASPAEPPAETKRKEYRKLDRFERAIVQSSRESDRSSPPARRAPASGCVRLSYRGKAAKRPRLWNPTLAPA